MRYPFFLIYGIFFGGKLANAFYIPGALPQSFSTGDEVKLKVNKVTSPKNLIPLDYYFFPYCQPEGGPVLDHENLGEFLAGDRIKSSPYELRMQEEAYCKKLCVMDLGKPTGGMNRSFYKGLSRREKKKIKEQIKRDGRAPKPIKNLLEEGIRRGYHNNWIVDNLSAATKTEDDNFITTRYYRGFPMGFVGRDRSAYIYNHVNIEIMYHPVDNEVGKYRVVRFTVEPFSINHKLKEDKNDPTGYTIQNPITSCDKNSLVHTGFEMSRSAPPQPAFNEVMFTYDVIWTENLELHWASRWDIYLNMDNAIPAKIHWSSIVNSVLVAIILSTFVAGVLLRTLKADISRYNQVKTDEEKAEELEDVGWKLVHADVFRPPSFSPLLLAVATGSGMQLLCMSALTVIFAALGFLNPSFRGSMLMFLILFYALMGIVSGYVTARLYKTFKGKRWQLATTLTATSFPGLAFAVFFILDLVAVSHHSTDAVPFTTMFVLLLLWFGLSTPLVFLGSYFGYKKDPIHFPVNTSQIPKEIPAQPWYMGSFLTCAMAGLIPYGCAFVEMYFIMSSMWMGQYYYVFGVLVTVFLLVNITCAEVSILSTYFQLCAEDYQWWWRSFCTSGSLSIYLFIQSIHYFTSLETNNVATYFLYFGYMGLICIGVFLMTGSVGFFSALMFNKTIYGAIKVD